MRVADYVVQKLAKYGVNHVFMVAGGGAMHLNDAIASCKNISAICCHHEQACAIAAESYFRVTNKLAAVCVTTGPGGTNAITGVFGAFVDSMPMIVISGQVKWNTLVRSTNLPLRQLGDQEVDIITMVSGITKYSVLIQDALSVRYHLERALHLAVTGRPGPVWIDIPINIQGTEINPENQTSYNPEEDAITFETSNISEKINELTIRLKKAKRPIIYAGTGIRIAEMHSVFLNLVRILKIPVVTAWNSNDLIGDDDPVYAGRPGSIGNRPGNFAVQSSDLVLILGCRMNIRLVSYNWDNFAPNAFKVMVDIDAAELKKPTLKIDLPIHADLKYFLPALEKQMGDWTSQDSSWLNWCRENLTKYPVVESMYWKNETHVNPYCFVESLFDQLCPEDVVVCGDGTACVTTFQAARIQNGQRVFHNSGCASMGYDIPAAIGAAIALKTKKRIICIAGDGSIMMNLQELQTIVGYRLPIKIFILNNEGYHSIRQTQNSFFPGNEIGCGKNSGLTFPNFKKIAVAFGYKYQKCQTHGSLRESISKTLEGRKHSICEIALDLNQNFAPKLSSRRNLDGSMTTSSLEDMAPFLPRDEIHSIMNMWK